MFLVYLLVVNLSWVFEGLSVAWGAELLSSQVRHLKETFIRHRHDESLLVFERCSLYKNRRSNCFWRPNESHVFVHHKVAIIWANYHHKARCLQSLILASLRYNITSFPVFIFINISSCLLQMVGLDTTRCVVQPTLISDFTLLIKNKKCRFCYNNDICWFWISVVVSYNIAWLFTEVTYPIRLYLWGGIFLLLCISLLVNLIVCEGLHTTILVTFNFEVWVSNYYTFSRL
jgi:hypothetical protein